MKKSFNIFKPCDSSAGLKPFGALTALKSFFIASAAVCFLSSCTIDEDKSYGDRTDYEIHYALNYRYLDPVYRLIQDVDFFSQYRDLLQESEEDAEALADKFLSAISIGTRNYELDENHLYTSHWGTVTIGDADGEFIGIPYNAEDDAPQYSITYTDENSFEISCERQSDLRYNSGPCEFDFCADVEFTENETVRTTNFQLNYSETVDGEVLNVSVTSGDALTGRVWENYWNYNYGSSKEVPRSGTLYYTVSGKYNFTFRVEFQGDKYAVISADGYTVYSW